MAAPKQKVYGLLAEYGSPEDLMRACEVVRDSGYKHWDSHTPFPIHGIERHMGIKMTILPWLALGGGLTGMVIALLLQWYTNAYDYPFVISGKPIFSLPANIPVTFELTILLAAFGTFFGMLALNNLPELFHPLFRKKRFLTATSHGFFLSIEAKDELFDDEITQHLLSTKTPAVAVELCHDNADTNDVVPPWLFSIAAIGLCVALVPFALAAKARHTKSADPAFHVIPDMDWQPYYRAQSQNPVFADQRAMRPDMPGTVARGELQDDDHMYRGLDGGAWATQFPGDIDVDAATMDHGQERYNIYCAPCHGISGRGDGMVSVRAESLQEGTWVQPTDLHQPYLHGQPVGQLFNTITHGIRNMPPYGPIIPPEDRWAIIMYVRALQRSQAAQVQDVPADRRSGLPVMPAPGATRAGDAPADDAPAGGAPADGTEPIPGTRPYPATDSPNNTNPELPQPSDAPPAGGDR